MFCLKGSFKKKDSKGYVSTNTTTMIILYYAEGYLESFVSIIFSFVTVLTCILV